MNHHLAPAHCHLPQGSNHDGEACYCFENLSPDSPGPYIVTMPKPTIQLAHCELCNRLYDKEDIELSRKHLNLMGHMALLSKEEYGAVVKNYWEKRNDSSVLEESLDDIRQVHNVTRAINLTEDALQRMDDDDLVEDALAGEIGWGGDDA